MKMLYSICLLFAEFSSPVVCLRRDAFEFSSILTITILTLPINRIAIGWYLSV